jgi:transcriptional regulator with XRE-family HTH domain
MPDATVGSRVRAARLAAGMSQTDVERASGIPKTMLSRYENDHVSPSLESLHRIAGALNISEGALIDETDQLAGFLFRELQTRGVQIVSEMQAIRVADAIGQMFRSATS